MEQLQTAKSQSVFTQTDCSQVWTALYTRSRHEKKVHANLKKLGLESFLPIRKSVRHWSDRKKIIEEPLFPGYLFIKINLLDRLQVFDAPGVVSFVEECPGTPASIPELQIISLQKFVDNELSIDPYPYLKTGRKVRIKNGPLKGVEGLIERKLDSCRLVLSIEFMQQSVSVEIDEALLELL